MQEIQQRPSKVRTRFAEVYIRDKQGAHGGRLITR